jgi:hypothetical protein
MPHSSGGGSSSGGFHSGSSENNSYRSSRTYFVGSSLYFFYDRKNNMHSMYSNQTPEKMKKNNIMSIIFLSIFLIFIAVVTFFVTYRNPKKIDLGSYNNTEIVIMDENNFLNDFENKQKLESSLLSFKENTGITPRIVFISNDIWKERNTNLEDYSYDRYLRLFKDESHWLIVYSSKLNTNKSDWYFEGMQGNDTDSIISDYYANSFTKHLHNNLKEDKLSVCDSIADSFDFINKDIMNKGFIFNYRVIIPLSITEVIILFLLITTVIKTLNLGKYQKSKVQSSKAIIKECPKCRTKYILGEINVCPKCNTYLLNSHLLSDDE